MEKIWLSRYPEGVPAEIGQEAGFNSLVDVFEDGFGRFAGRPAYCNMGITVTYAQVDRMSHAFAAYLQEDLGLEKGSRIALMMPNLLQYPVALIGALRAGLAIVNVNPLYTPRELEHQLKDSGAVAIVIFASSAHVLEKILDHTPVKHVIVTRVGDLFPPIKRTVVNFTLRWIKKMEPEWSIPRAERFREAISKGRERSFQDVNVTGEDMAILQYTGGTTGVAKGAVLTHRNMVANVQQLYSWFKPTLKDATEIVVTPLPLYHIFSLTANFLTFFKFGALNLLITNPREMSTLVKALASMKFTAMTGVNTLFNALLASPDFHNLDFSSFKVCVGGGMAVHRSVAAEWKRVTGVPLAEGYGLTEASPVVSVNRLDIGEYNGSIGMPLPSTEVSIRDEEDEEVALGEPGELWIRGPQVMRGYWEHPEETDKVLTADGWLKSGDIARVDQEGFIRIVDRKKDMILVSGFNVYPNGIEAVVAGHEGVLEVAAVGVPDRKSGEAVKICVVKKNPNLDADILKAFCREKLAGYKVPKHIEFRDELPKSAVGKILRRLLREESN